MGNSDKKKQVIMEAMLATAAWIEMEAELKLYEACALRGENEEAEKHRQRAHEMLDTYLDLNVSGMIGATSAKR